MSGKPKDPLALSRIAATNAAEVVAKAGLGQPVQRLLRPEQTPREFVDALVQQQMYAEVLTFLAFGLPRREAVWWGALFLLWSGAGRLKPEDARALQAITRWVVEPTEEHRQAAAEFENPETPTGRLAQAVKRTGGSMLPPTAPVRPPSPEMTPRGVNAAINAAILQGDPKTLGQRLRQAVALGMHIARGNYLWTAPPTVSNRR